MLAQTIGHYTLNLSMIIYLIIYFPQLYHNRKKHLNDLSLHFHNLLLICYLTDLMYGFGLSMPWQYRIVSMVTFSCLLYQHKQLSAIYRHNRYFIFSTCSFLIIAIFGFIAVLSSASKSFFINVGYISQAVGLIYAVPQIYKNIGTIAAASLSIWYLLMSLFCSSLDNISAWTLQWPIPTKLGAIISVLFFIILIVQWFMIRRKLIIERINN